MEARLEAVLDLIEPVGCVADIGAGDGALARRLAARGQPVVATEFRPGAFARLAARAVPGMVVRRGDGLEAIGRAEAEQLVITGMGPANILGILRRGRERLAEFRRVVLLPHHDAWPLREAAAGLGLAICDERIVAQGSRLYQPLALVPVPDPPLLSPLAVLLGPVNLERQPPELALLVEHYRRRFRARRTVDGRMRLWRLLLEEGVL